MSTFADSEAIYGAWGGYLALRIYYGKWDGYELQIVALLLVYSEVWYAIYHSKTIRFNLRRIAITDYY
jgi:hypothetical protein